VALSIALARIATGADPPFAVLAGYLGVVGLSGPLRAIVLLDAPLARTLFAALCALCVGAYWVVASRIAEPMLALGVGPLAANWRPCIATGVGALLLAPFLKLLPGLSPLQAD